MPQKWLNNDVILKLICVKGSSKNLIEYYRYFTTAHILELEKYQKLYFIIYYF